MIKPEHTYLLYHLIKMARIEDKAMIVETTWQEIASAMSYKLNKKDITYSKNTIYRCIDSLIKNGLIRRCNRYTFSFFIIKNQFSEPIAVSCGLGDTVTNYNKESSVENDHDLGNELREPVSTCVEEINEEKETNVGNDEENDAKCNERRECVIHCEATLNRENIVDLGKDLGKLQKKAEPRESVNTNDNNDLQEKNDGLREPLLNNLNNLPNSVGKPFKIPKDWGNQEGKKKGRTPTMGNNEENSYYNEPEHIAKKKKKKSKKNRYIDVSQMPKSTDFNKVEVGQWKAYHFVSYYRSQYYKYWRIHESPGDGCEGWKSELPMSIKASQDISKIFDRFEELGCENFTNINMRLYFEWYFLNWYSRYVRLNQKLQRNNEQLNRLSLKSLLSDKAMAVFIQDSDIYCANDDYIEIELEEDESEDNTCLEKNVEIYYGWGITNALTKFGLVIVSAYMVKNGVSLRDAEAEIDEKILKFVKLQRGGAKMNHLKEIFTATVENGPYWDGAPFSDWRNKYENIMQYALMESLKMEYAGEQKKNLDFLM